MPFIFLSGVVWPFGVIPTAVNLFAKLIPSTSVMHGLVRLNQMNASFYMTLSYCLILWILCLFYYFFCIADYKQQNNNESPPAYADGIILGQTKLVLNLSAHAGSVTSKS